MNDSKARWNANRRIFATLALCLTVLLSLFPGAAQSQPAKPLDATKYLTFQIFTAGPDPKEALGSSVPLPSPPSKRAIAEFVQNIIDAIGSKGSKDARLGFTVGPLAFDHTDEELRRLIRESFEIAQEKNVAVAFHIDDSMFWGKRPDLWSKRANIEWMDWSATTNTGRAIDWGAPLKLAPQMCFNSQEIRAEVKRRSHDVIGREIRKGMDNRNRSGNPDLFAGVIAGWETQIGKDFETKKALGYCALSNQGYGPKHNSNDLDLGREKAVRGFIVLWTTGLAEAGIDRRKIYSHIGFPPLALYEQTLRALNSSDSYSQLSNFAPPAVSFHEAHNPGFSTYPAPGLFDQIYEGLKHHGKRAWASAEGVNASLGAPGGMATGMTMETYLAKHFNHGATLVNMFAWGVGGPTHKHLQFRIAAEGPNALMGYRKFLKGAKLTEEPNQEPSASGFEAKMRRIKKDLPAWVQKTGNQPKAELLLRKLDGHMKNQQPQQAEQIADEILNLIK